MNKDKSSMYLIIGYFVAISGLLLYALYVDYSGFVLLRCPDCLEVFGYHKPNKDGEVWTSIGETYIHPPCGTELFIVTYYDGEVVMMEK